jgi:serine/threonine protein kinase/beta-lactam-binding protein with PASTA domain
VPTGTRATDRGCVDVTATDPLVGRLLDGRYRVGPQIARGGMATVYEATDNRLDRVVAIKVMNAGLAADMDFTERFVLEARSAARLSHPNAVSVFDQGDDDGLLFLAMEYVAGHTLRDQLRDRGPMSASAALAMLDPILSALAAAHDAGFVHRDVKPENVLITDDGRVKVADFGLARALTTSTSVASTGGPLIGTVSYLSPELVLKGSADARSDVYSVGVMLYEMLTGRKPHRGDSPIQVAYKHVHEDVPPPSREVGGIPPYLDALVARATARERELRPADAKVFLHQVRRVMHAIDHGVTDDPELTEDLTPTTAIGGGRLGDDAIGMTELITAGEAESIGSDPFGLPSSSDRTRGPEDTLVQAPVEPDESPQPAAPSLSTNPPARPWPPSPRPHRRRGIVLLILVLLLALLAGVAGWYYGVARFTTTPAVVGQSMERAQRQVEAAGLTFSVAGSEFSETVPAGDVISTDPGPGGRLPNDGTVAAVVSKGPERYEVPKVTGLDRAAAVTAIDDAHLSLGHTKEIWSQSVPAGNAISLSLPAGKSVRPDTAIVLTMSKGPRPVNIVDFTGQDGDQAEASLRQAGLSVDRRDRYNGTVKAGLVITQSPQEGTGYAGDTVTLVVSRGPHLVQIPRLRGVGVTDAEAQLKALGFEVNVQHAHPYYGLGYVVSQTPGADDTAPKGSEVTIVIA